MINLRPSDSRQSGRHLESASSARPKVSASSSKPSASPRTTKHPKKLKPIVADDSFASAQPWNAMSPLNHPVVRNVNKPSGFKPPQTAVKAKIGNRSNKVQHFQESPKGNFAVSVNRFSFVVLTVSK